MKTAPKLAPAALTVVAVLSLFAADQPTSKEAQRREMKKLDWFVGHWKGTGWIQMGPQGRHEFTQTETIEAKLDGLVLVIEVRQIFLDANERQNYSPALIPNKASLLYVN